MIYLAGSCSSEHRTLMVKIAKALREHNYDVYCPFELTIENAWDMSQEAWAYKVFQTDKNAIDKSDIFLMVTPGRSSSAGTNWEQGYAYATKNLNQIIVAQYTDAPTSIMTFWSSGIFINTDKINIIDDILSALKDTYDNKPKCTTILT